MTRSRSQSDYMMDKTHFQTPPDRIQIPETRIQMSATCHDFGLLTADANMNTLDTLMSNPAHYRRRPSSMRRKSFIGNHVGYQQHRNSDGSNEVKIDVPTITTSLGSDP
uniref:Uncharacterized protein n=2 Tax=Acrobeloides nanus TaxID=290746 RepID=A0A914C3L4_9BILA